MPSSYTQNLRLVLPVTGELQGAWGVTLNNGLTTLVDHAIAGTVTVTIPNANYVLSALNELADEARNMFIRCTGTLTAQRDVICPAVSKLYFVTNATTGGFGVHFKTAAGAGIVVPAGQSMMLYCDGTNVVQAATNVGTVSGTFNGNAATVTNGVYTTGNQTIGGTKTFSSTIGGSITGNAATATALQTARTINGVSFNGTANITLPTVNQTGETGSAITPTGTTAQRDSTPVAGYFRFNTTLGKFEGYTGSAWGSVGGGATGGGSDEVFVENSQVVTTSYTLTAGRNAHSAGPITINDGVTVTISDGSRWVIS